MNVTCFKIGAHMGLANLANLASFHHMEFSGLLVCHSGDPAKMNCSGFAFVAIYLRWTKIEDYKVV